MIETILACEEFKIRNYLQSKKAGIKQEVIDAEGNSPMADEEKTIYLDD